MWSPTPNWPVLYPIHNYAPNPYQPALPAPSAPPQPVIYPSQYPQKWLKSTTPHNHEPANLPPPQKLEPGQILERANEHAPGSMVNIINAISGGSNEPVHETKKKCKEYFRTVSHVSEGRCFRTTWSHVPISFTQADLRLQHYPHNDPLVIRANIGKNSVHFAGNDVGRILVDNGSSADILVWQCFVSSTEEVTVSAHWFRRQENRSSWKDRAQCHVRRRCNAENRSNNLRCGRH